MGIAKAMGWDNPFTQFVGSNRNALSNIGYGMIGAKNLSEFAKGATGGAIQGGEQDRQIASANELRIEEEQARQDKITQAQEQQNQTMQWMQQSAPNSFAQLQSGLPMDQAFKLAQEEYQLATQPPEDPKLTTAIQNYQYGVENPDFAQNQLAGKRASAVNVNVGGQPSAATIGQKEIDKKYAPEYIDWRASGGSSDIEKQIGQLDFALENLRNNPNLTGPVVGSVPDVVSKFTNPQSIATREAVEEVVQRNLRLILGAQFTEKEGERLIARAYNPNLQEGENIARVERLINQMRQAAQAKDSAAQYYEQYGTLSGWTGKLPTIADMEAAIEGQTPQGGGIPTANDPLGLF